MQKENQIFCNCCGKAMQRQGDMYTEEFVHIKKDWGYFSDRDGITQEADVCETCIQTWMDSFEIPPESHERSEL